MQRKRKNVQYSSKKKTPYKKPATKRGKYPQKLPASLISHKPEVKTLDFAWTDQNNVAKPFFNRQAFSKTGTIIPLNTMLEGASFNNRIGRKISMKSLRLTYGLEKYQVGTTLTDNLRVMVIYDRQTNGTPPTIPDILQAKTITNDTNTAGTGSLCYLNMVNSERFSVLMDKMEFFNDTSTGSSDQINSALNPHPITATNDRFIKLKGLETTYKGNAGTTGDLATGGLFLVLVSLETQCAMRFVGAARLRYNDV